MNEIETLLRTSAKLSSIDESKLLRRKASLEDCRSLLEEIEKETRTCDNWHEVDTAIGATLILVSLVSDVIRDTAGEEVSASNPLMKLGLEKIYDKARDKKWAGNKYESTIEAINKNTGYLEKAIDIVGGKGPSAKMIKMAINVHKQMAMNIMGLKGFVDDAEESRLALRQSLSSLEKQIKVMLIELENVDFYLKTGEGAKSEPRMSIAVPRSLG